MEPPARQPARFFSSALRRSRAVLGSFVTLFALACTSRHWGTPDAMINGAFAIAGAVGLWVGSWPIIGAVAGTYLGGMAGASLGSSPMNPLIHGLLLAVVGTVVGCCLQQLERDPRLQQ